MNPNITEGNVTWFWCNAHKESHTGDYCSKGKPETCLDVGPYSTKEDADDFPANV
jgi:hypothetical protein